MATENKQGARSAGRQVYVVIFALTLIRDRGRTGTQEIQQILADKGMNYSLRSIQRWLNAAAEEGVPLCHDDKRPSGWWWHKEPSNTDQAWIETVKELRPFLQEASHDH